jgi:hypothetical protein
LPSQVDAAYGSYVPNVGFSPKIGPDTAFFRRDRRERAPNGHRTDENVFSQNSHNECSFVRLSWPYSTGAVWSIELPSRWLARQSLSYANHDLGNSPWNAVAAGLTRTSLLFRWRARTLVLTASPTFPNVTLRQLAVVFPIRAHFSRLGA